LGVEDEDAGCGKNEQGDLDGEIPKFST
jgi:hypothetical protein